MRAAVRVERHAFTDPRIVTLGKLLGVKRREALGHVIELWSYCTDAGAYALDAHTINAIAERDDFAKAFVECGLGVETQRGIRVRGTKGRIEWLGNIRAGAIKGGEATKNKAKTAIPPVKPPGSRKSPKGAPGEPLPSPPVALREPLGGSTATALTTTKATIPDPEVVAAPLATPGDHKRFVEWFTDRYEAYHQAKAVWIAADFANVKKLLAALGLEELQRRADVMFDMGGKYPCEHPDIKTLMRSITALTGSNARAGPNRRVDPNNITSADIRAAAARMFDGESE